MSRPLPSTCPVPSAPAGDPPAPPHPGRAPCPASPGRPAPTGQRDALQRDDGGSGWAQLSATPGRRLRREFASRGFPPGGGALGLGRGSARPLPPPPLPAPLPGPWRLRGCRSERWSRARGGRAGGKVRRRQEPRGLAGQPGGRLRVSRVPSRGSRVRCAARGRRCGSRVRGARPGFLALPGPRPRGGWCRGEDGAAPGLALSAGRGGLRAPAGEGAQRGGAGAARRGGGRAPSGGRARTRSRRPGRVAAAVRRRSLALRRPLSWPLPA